MLLNHTLMPLGVSWTIVYDMDWKIRYFLYRKFGLKYITGTELFISFVVKLVYKCKGHLLVPMLDVCPARQQQLDELVVPAGAGERERCVVVGVRLAVHVHRGVGGGRGLRRLGLGRGVRRALASARTSTPRTV